MHIVSAINQPMVMISWIGNIIDWGDGGRRQFGETLALKNLPLKSLLTRLPLWAYLLCA